MMKQYQYSGAVVSKLMVLLVIVGAVACEDQKRIEHPGPDEAWESIEHADVDQREVVAEVDGHPITRRDVEAAWRDNPDADVDEVIDELVEREVLVRTARQRDYHQRPEVAFARKQGMVSALLRDEIEKKAEPDDSRRDRMFEGVKATRRVPEGLRASHLVVVVPDELEDDEGETYTPDDEEREQLFERAREYVKTAFQFLDGRIDDDALREVADELEEEVLPDEFQTTVNVHMRFPRAGEVFDPDHLPDGWITVVPEFAEGAESVADDDHRGEVLSEPVRSDYGWHLIRVDEVFESRPVDPEVAEAFVDFELETQARQMRLQQQLEQWAEGVRAELYPDRLGSPLDE